MKISIPPIHIAIFTNRTKAAISNTRTRLAKRLLGEQNSTEKLDAFISDLQYIITCSVLIVYFRKYKKSSVY